MEKEWDSAYRNASLPEVLSSNTWVIKNVRDFSYVPGTDTTVEHWVERTVQLEQVTGGSFYVAPLKQFGVLQHIFAHTCLGFTFKDGTEIVCSLEARRGKGEIYKPITRGMRSGYRLIYLFTTLRDLIAFRIVQRKQGVIRYPLMITQLEVKAILVSALETTRKISLQKELPIYHTLRNSCTSALLPIMNKGLTHKIPPHLYWYLTGLSPRLLARHGIIDLLKKEMLNAP